MAGKLVIGPVRLGLVSALMASIVSASVAWSGIPDPTNNIVPPCGVLLPALGDAHPPTLGLAPVPFTVLVRDALNMPVPGQNVYLDASGAPDIRFAADPGPGKYIDCERMRVYGVTDDRGSVTFYLRGAGRNSLPGGGIGPGGFNKVKVIAGATQIRLVTLLVPDENGAGSGGTVVNGIDATDGAFFRYDLLNYWTTAGRSDFNCSGVVDAADGSILRDYIFNDPASAPPQQTTYCP